MTLRRSSNHPVFEHNKFKVLTKTKKAPDFSETFY